MTIRTLEQLKRAARQYGGAVEEGPLRVFYASPDRGSFPPEYGFARWWGKGRGYEVLTEAQAEALLAEEAHIRDYLGED